VEDSDDNDQEDDDDRTFGHESVTALHKGVPRGDTVEKVLYVLETWSRNSPVLAHLSREQSASRVARY
jgi:hypothetical protein